MKNKNSVNSDATTLKVNEIFYSIQGESTRAGRPCVFIRLTYCNLRCTYCDTTYAFFEGQEMTLSQITDKVSTFNCSLVEITGGEPLIQKDTYILMQTLCDQGYEVLLETAGHMDISEVDQRVSIIMDLKCPSSGESEKMLWSNLDHIKPRDEIKFVVGTNEDLDWATTVIDRYHLAAKCTLLFSPVFGKMDHQKLAEWILKSGLPVRMQLQMHKFIWHPDAKGV